MAVISFRRPEDGLDYYKQALDLINVLQDIVKNPNAANSVRELSKELTAAQELSERQKQEARDAAEIIAQSKEFLEDFEQKKREHAAEVKFNNLDIENKRKQLEADIAAHENYKLSSKKVLDKQKNELEVQISLHKQNLEKANSRHSQADLREKKLLEEEKQLQKQKEEFEKYKTQEESLLAVQKSALAEKREKLDADRATLEDRKKRLDALLKEAQ